MRIPIFFVFFIIIIVVSHIRASRSENNLDGSQKRFWEKEQASHYVRKKELTEEDYIKGHVDLIPDFKESDYEAWGKTSLYKAQEQLRETASKEMINLSGMLNSDVRLKYGTAQLDLIESLENNFNNYIQGLSLLGSELAQLDHKDIGQTLLEEAIQVGSDVSHTYMNLSDLYKDSENTEALKELLKKSSQLNSIMKSKIIKHIESHIESLEPETTDEQDS